MLFTHLGHAMWLTETAELRLLFDPLLSDVHHGGVFEVFPRRELDVAALQPDFIVVSHRHPDHFDVHSLRRLAREDADSVVLTSDDLVADTAKRLGFREVRVLGTYDRVSLSGAELLTTPSFAADVEWGMIVREGEVFAYNQVDTVLRDVRDATAVMADAGQAFGLERPLRPHLAIVRYQPLLEVEAVLGERAGFPFDAYGLLLDQVAAIDAHATLPGSAGSRHADAYAYMNRLVYPVPEPRFVRDLRVRAPRTRVLESRMGARYELAEDGARELGPSPLADARSADDDRSFRPIELPPLRDTGRVSELGRARIRGFVVDELAPALERAWPNFAVDRPLTFVLLVVYASDEEAFRIEVGPGTRQVSLAFDDDYDALNSVAGSLFLDVLEGRRHWGEPLLAGSLRSSLRAYRVDAKGLTRARVGPLFLYYALGYEESVRRATEFLISSPEP
ncbi:MAG: MBL fold metallo-hydrolase [Polyangiaceae bacterium]